MPGAVLARYPLPREATLLAAMKIESVHPHADVLDDDFSFPEAEVANLHRLGLLLAPFPRRLGGSEFAIGPEAPRLLLPVLRRIGAANLSLGRLYEGHVNAAGLVMRYGRREQVARLSKEAAGGVLLGVWNTEGANRLQLLTSGSRWRLKGGKILCSGAGHIERPLVTAKDEAGRVVMVMPRLRRGERADLSSWTPQGMRASATGAVDFTDVGVEPEDIIGEDGDYQRQPAFSGGAWRCAAVQLGGMEKLLDLLRDHLVKTKRGNDPHQSARVGECIIAVESARLWVERAAELAEGGTAAGDAIAAYVNLTRIAVERAALELLPLVHRSVGLAAFLRPHPIERISRDLATYLRQPAPDRALCSAAAWTLEQTSAFAELWT